MQALRGMKVSELNNIDKKELMRRLLPSEEELKALERSREEKARANPTCFMNWFPTVRKLKIPAPASIVIDFPLWLTKDIINGLGENDQTTEALKGKVEAIRAFGEDHGYPLFLKNSLYSDKFNWANSCFISAEATDAEIIQKICTITYNWMCVGADYSLYLVVREFIHTKPAFHAFNDMPITEEYRIFARDGKVEGWQPYWPENAIREPSVDGWKTLLKEISTPSKNELSTLCALAENVTRNLGGYWSVDFLKDQNGEFYLIDMAVGERSYKCPEGYRSIP